MKVKDMHVSQQVAAAANKCHSRTGGERALPSLTYFEQHGCAAHCIYMCTHYVCTQAVCTSQKGRGRALQWSQPIRSMPEKWGVGAPCSKGCLSRIP